jgi:hypothetical protein
VIDLPVTDAEPKLVIEAKYDAVKEEVFVKISKTINVFSADDFPIITGATVEIIDENGVVTPLVDQADGTYLLENYTPTYNGTYTMNILVDGISYEATDYLPTVVTLDSLTTEFQAQSPFFDAGYLLYVNVSDPAGPNFYRAIRKINGKYRRNISDQFLFDDGFTEGNNQKVPLFSEFYEVGDTIELELLSYSEKSFTYYQELRAIAAGAEASAAPANPTSTWSNECLGHFSTFGYDTKTIVVEE